MAQFRRIEDKFAGPQAVGILIPPGPRTMIILRPRALAWDILAIHDEDLQAECPTFRSFSRDEAALLARHLRTELETAGANHQAIASVLENPWGDGFVPIVRCIEFPWIACYRRPGQAYQGVIFLEEEDAHSAAKDLQTNLCPDPVQAREVYFNTQHFHG